MPLNVVSSVGFLWGPWPGTRTCGDSVGPPRAYLWTPRRPAVWVRVRSPRAESADVAGQVVAAAQLRHDPAGERLAFAGAVHGGTAWVRGARSLPAL